MKLYLVSIIEIDAIEEFEPTHFTSTVSMREAQQKALDSLNADYREMGSDHVWTLENLFSDETGTLAYDEQELEI